MWAGSAPAQLYAAPDYAGLVRTCACGAGDEMTRVIWQQIKDKVSWRGANKLFKCVCVCVCVYMSLSQQIKVRR